MAEGLWLSPDSAYGVRERLKSHAQFRGEVGDKPRGKLQVEPLEQGGEEQEHLHPGKLLTQALPSPYRLEKKNSRRQINVRVQVKKDMWLVWFMTDNIYNRS